MRVFLFLLLFLIPPAFAAGESYICPMHPHISGEQGDNCPICGMTLVSQMDAAPEGGFHIDPSYVQALGVKTAEVIHHEFGRAIRSFGRIAASTRLEYSMDMREEGWVVDLTTNAVGDTVKKGDLLFTYYSPDLMTAQSDYLIDRRREGSSAKRSENRLRLYGMDDKAIALFKERGRMMEAAPFHAPIDGTITMLNIRQGSFVKEGNHVLTLQDFSQVWVNVDVPVRDVQFLEVGTPAKITVPETGADYETVIDYIHPVAGPQSRTVMVRLILENQGGALKPDTYVDASFNANAQSRLAVPMEAVLYGSMGSYVMEDAGEGYFRAVMVDVGITANGFTEITNGLSHGQRIVTSGQFMLDAESNLRGGLKNMKATMGGGHDH